MEDNSFISDSTSIEEIEIKCKRYEYDGYEPSIGFGDKIDIIEASIKKETFFDEYVLKRRPVIIRDLLKDEDFKTQNWTLSYLKEKAGDCKVMVEDRSKSKTSDTFGIKAPKIVMNYSQFLDHLLLGDENLYLTTQDLDSGEVDKFGMCTAIFGDPLVRLKEDFPRTPKCLAFLVPHLVSLWQGRSKEGTSSGLHHDFHDNLYLVVRGCKKFRILPPSSHEFLRMPIKPVRIYSNGLIVYSRNKYFPDLIPVRSDGVPYEFLAQTIRDEAKRERTRCRISIKKLEKENVTGELLKKLNNEKLEYEMQIETAEEEMAQYNGQESDGESNHISIQDSDEEPTEKKSKNEVEPKPLEHFSTGSLNTSEKDFDKIFANFEKRSDLRGLEVDLNEGDALYLPASWFHDVTSFSRNSTESETSQLADPDHLALSYWFYPPDGESVDTPYINSFWRDRLQKIADGSDDIMPANCDDSCSEKEEMNDYDVIVLGSDDDDEQNDENDYYSDEEEDEEGSPWRPRSVEIDHFSEHSVDSNSSSPIFVSSVPKLDSTTCLSFEGIGENFEKSLRSNKNSKSIDEDLVYTNNMDDARPDGHSLNGIEQAGDNIESLCRHSTGKEGGDFSRELTNTHKFPKDSVVCNQPLVSNNGINIALDTTGDNLLLENNEGDSLELLLGGSGKSFEPGLASDMILDSFKDKVLNGLETEALLTE